LARENLVKSKLASGGSAIGTWVQSPSPTVANVLAHSGMDFVTVDMEHGSASFDTAETMMYAIEAGGSTPMIRLGEGSAPTILRAADIGAQGILVAHVQSGPEADRIVRAMKYHPSGDRGLAPFTRIHDFSGADLQDKLDAANREQLSGVLVEDAEGLRNLEEILAVEDLDLLYLGIYDLSQTLGLAGQLDHPTVHETVRDAVRQIEAAGKVAGAVARDRDHLKWLLDTGFRYISYLVDTAILAQGFREARSWYDELIAR
jgi:2-keto-3-deoxy-L-rhamnonate aldolase RhmA